MPNSVIINTIYTPNHQEKYKPTSESPINVAGLTEADFLHIPAYAQRIYLAYHSIVSTDAFTVTLGDEDSFKTTGYNWNSARLTATITMAASTAGFEIPTETPPLFSNGILELQRATASNIWVASLVSSSNVGMVRQGAGSLDIAKPLTRIRFSSTTALTSGTVNIMYS